MGALNLPSIFETSLVSIRIVAAADRVTRTMITQEVNSDGSGILAPPLGDLLDSLVVL